MKAEELMIGDWVFIKDYPMIVQPMQVKKEHFVRSLVEFEPIPLTPEILKKNGLANDPYGCHFEEDEYMSLEISVEEEGIYWTINYNEYGILKLKYVHELQHALKLCRIDKEIVV
jgi:hypothetical protein